MPVSLLSGHAAPHSMLTFTWSSKVSLFLSPRKGHLVTQYLYLLILHRISDAM